MVAGSIETIESCSWHSIECRDDENRNVGEFYNRQRRRRRLQYYSNSRVEQRVELFKFGNEQQRKEGKVEFHKSEK